MLARIVRTPNVFTLLMLEMEFYSLCSQVTAESLRTHLSQQFRVAVLQVILDGSLICSLPFGL